MRPKGWCRNITVFLLQKNDNSVFCVQCLTGYPVLPSQQSVKLILITAIMVMKNGE